MTIPIIVLIGTPPGGSGSAVAVGLVGAVAVVLELPVNDPVLDPSVKVAEDMSVAVVLAVAPDPSAVLTPVAVFEPSTVFVPGLEVDAEAALVHVTVPEGSVMLNK